MFTKLQVPRSYGLLDEASSRTWHRVVW